MLNVKFHNVVPNQFKADFQRKYQEVAPWPSSLSHFKSSESRRGRDCGGFFGETCCCECSFLCEAQWDWQAWCIQKKSDVLGTAFMNHCSWGVTPAWAIQMGKKAGSLLPCDQPSFPALSGQRPCQCCLWTRHEPCGRENQLRGPIGLPTRAEGPKQQA